MYTFVCAVFVGLKDIFRFVVHEDFLLRKKRSVAQ